MRAWVPVDMDVYCKTGMLERAVALEPFQNKQQTQVWKKSLFGVGFKMPGISAIRTCMVRYFGRISVNSVFHSCQPQEFEISFSSCISICTVSLYTLLP